MPKQMTLDDGRLRLLPLRHQLPFRREDLEGFSKEFDAPTGFDRKRPISVELQVIRPVGLLVTHWFGGAALAR
jgi:hypothetical protein